jgi:hypothetical protein
LAKIPLANQSLAEIVLQQIVCVAQLGIGLNLILFKKAKTIFSCHD